MGVSWACLSLFALFLTPFPLLVTAQPEPAYGYLPVNSPISWTSIEPTGDFYKPNEGIILASKNFSNLQDGSSACSCGFIYNQTCKSSLFVISTTHSYASHLALQNGANVLWSINPNKPVRYNATLKLTSERGLVLQDADGTIAWSTNIGNRSVAGLILTDTCNLKLMDENNATIWQSFDHPTDTLVLGQKLGAGKQLTSKGGLFSLSLKTRGLFAYIDSQLYLIINPSGMYYDISYVQFRNQTLAFFNQSSKLIGELEAFSTSPMKYVRLESDGHLRAYDDYWNQGYPGYDVFTQYIDGGESGDCTYPTICGNYSVCSEGQCSCPPPINGKSYFQRIDDRLPNRGCSPVTALSCEASKNHILLELKNITYFPFSNNKGLAGLSPEIYAFIDPDYQHMTLENCTHACLKNCSCKAAIYDSSSILGNSISV